MFDACNIYLQTDKVTVEDTRTTFCTKHHAEKYSNINSAEWRIPAKKVPDLNCEVHDLLLDVVDIKQEMLDLRSGRISPI